MNMLQLSVEIKEQTQAAHQSLEKQVVGIIKSIQSLSDYANLLRLFHAYFGGVELLVDKVLDKNLMPDYAERRKTELLKNDLQILNYHANDLLAESDLPRISDHFEALGAMYVMEGSTLGGVHISRMIREKLPALDENAISFFTGYKNQTQEMWQKFRQALDKDNFHKEDRDKVIACANDTFEKFGVWIRKS